MSQSRGKLFLQNLVVYGLGGIISKAVPLIMLPIVTRMMPNTEYFGINDVQSVIVQFGSAIAVLGMYDAMFRLFFDRQDQEYQKEICSTTSIFTFGMAFLVCMILILLRDPLGKLFFGTYGYSYLMIIAALNILFGANNNIICAPTRMRNQRKVFLVTNTLSPMISYGVAIPLLWLGKYTLALPLASLLSSLTLLIVFGVLNRRWFSPACFRWRYLKPLLKIALPLVPNFLVYWIFSSSDRLMITNMLGAGQEGIYAIGGKIGQISNLIYQAFAGGWQYFAFSTMKDDDQVTMTSNIFEYLGIVSFVAGAFMMAFNNWIFTVLFTGDYQKGAIVSPYLFVAPLLLMLFQTACNQFLVIKKTWPNMLILSVGAVSNIAINWVLIPRIGIEGAAIGTLAGYGISVFLCVVVLQFMGLMAVKPRFLVATALFLAMALCWRFVFMGNNVILVVLAVALTLEYAILYKAEIKKLLKKMKKA